MWLDACARAVRQRLASAPGPSSSVTATGGPTTSGGPVRTCWPWTTGTPSWHCPSQRWSVPPPRCTPAAFDRGRDRDLPGLLPRRERCAWSQDDHQVAGAAGLWARLFDARKELTSGSSSAADVLQHDVARRADLAGL